MPLSSCNFLHHIFIYNSVLKFAERHFGLRTSASISATDIVAFCTSHMKSLGYTAGALSVAQCCYESRNLNYVCLQTHGHKRVLMLSLPDGQTSTILNSRAFLRAFLSCVRTKPIAKKPYEVVQSCNMSMLFLSGPRCTTTAVDDFWELEATIYDVGQISLSHQWKEAKKWILCAFVWVAVPIDGP